VQAVGGVTAGEKGEPRVEPGDLPFLWSDRLH
jgi:hypothetical protein